ncbi:hypothetical protein [Microbulbifer sediminum]|uniref:hypothetical protein n=1 Tax=Microbulbifer sediminum TaxID=2904250 RepID=UPI001F40C4F1|nr:hypothetical protein [Microbulbifer sediminum]
MTPRATTGEPMISPLPLAGAGDMGDLLHRRDHRLLELRLRVLAVADQVEAVGNPVRRERLAVAGGLVPFISG